jgi:hypothetical protein
MVCVETFLDIEVIFSSLCGRTRRNQTHLINCISKDAILGIFENMYIHKKG